MDTETYILTSKSVFMRKGVGGGWGYLGQFCERGWVGAGVLRAISRGGVGGCIKAILSG